YRDRSEMEVRDMSIVRLVDGEWTAPQTIYADGVEVEVLSDQCGSRADAVGNTLAVAWFAATNINSTVKLIFRRMGAQALVIK
ncbi:MAG: exo-alpha-sialidase, partial [Cytophagales bacterium]|nr:exo-alpha-sialidase [Cytophagales bacterium]